MKKIIQISSNTSGSYSICDLFCLTEDGKVYEREGSSWKELKYNLK